MRNGRSKDMSKSVTIDGGYKPIDITGGKSSGKKSGNTSKKGKKTGNGNKSTKK